MLGAMVLAVFMAICPTQDPAQIAPVLVSEWGLTPEVALASAQQWAPNFRGFMAQGALMGLYNDLKTGEDARAVGTLMSYFKLDSGSAKTAAYAIKATFAS